jgi:hypothetical protein
VRDFFRGPALDRPARLFPVGRRNRKLPGLITVILLAPLAWYVLHDTAGPATTAAPLPSPSPSAPPPFSPSPPAPTTAATTPPPSPTPTPTPTPSKRTLLRSKLAKGRTVKCARVVLAIDQSNSMDNYTSARDNALQQLIGWSHKNLGKRDQIAVIDFAGNAGVRQRPTSATTAGQIGPAVSLAGGSYYRPILNALQTFPKTSCKTALVLLSDGDLQDLPSDSSESGALLRDSGVKFQRLLVPDSTIATPPAWTTAFPNGKPVSVNGLDPDETARIIGETIAKIVDTKVVYY